MWVLRVVAEFLLLIFIALLSLLPFVSMVPIPWTALITLPALWFGARLARAFHLWWFFFVLAIATALIQGALTMWFFTKSEPIQLVFGCAVATAAGVLFWRTTRVSRKPVHLPGTLSG